MRGVGQVRLNMTLKQASRAVGAQISLRKSEYDDANECSYASRADGRDSNISYMMHHGRIVRIDIGPPGEGKKPTPVQTVEGLGIGSTERELRAAYGRRVKIGPHPYGDANDHYYVLDAPGKRRGIIFETWDGKVSEFRVGTYPAVQYIEGCS